MGQELAETTTAEATSWPVGNKKARLLAQQPTTVSHVIDLVGTLAKTAQQCAKEAKEMPNTFINYLTWKEDSRQQDADECIMMTSESAVPPDA